MNRMSSESQQTRLNGRVAIEMDKVNSKMDPMGRAIADYHKTKKASKLRVFSPMFEEDEIHGYAAVVIAEGEHYDYLARITKKV